MWRWTAGMAQMVNPLFIMDIRSHLRFYLKMLFPQWQDMPLRWFRNLVKPRICSGNNTRIMSFLIHHCILGIGIPTHSVNWKPLQHWTTDNCSWALKEYTWWHAAKDYTRWKGAQCAAIARSKLWFTNFCVGPCFFFSMYCWTSDVSFI